MHLQLWFLPVLTAFLGAVLAPLAVAAFIRPGKLRKLLEKILPDVLPMAETEVDTFLRQKLPKAMPVVGMFIGDKTIAQFKAIFMEELGTLLPDFIGNCAGKLAKALIYKAVAIGFVAGAGLGIVQELILGQIGPSGLLK
ncbi:hypothetical protein [Dinghuibacter silviterrae]|uniref:Uncharacterized protein n=1 Tax=Dinghuibacter silviterrae TaxID=1539049 RepID=A0A4R8DYE7_9BACT|nr:hypothetical protein [Dinghuibacter silviterrae]TDX02241.1 hypothetical protein EDB95_3295 [Dinghuibacter silviterrae]